MTVATAVSFSLVNQLAATSSSLPSSAKVSISNFTRLVTSVPLNSLKLGGTWKVWGKVGHVARGASGEVRYTEGDEFGPVQEWRVGVAVGTVWRIEID